MSASRELLPDEPLVWFVSAATASDAHSQRLYQAAGAGRSVITASLDGSPAPSLEVADGNDPPVHVDLAELGTRTFRERLLWHIEHRRNALANRGGVSRATRVTRWMLIGLGIFFAIVFGSLFHMSYYQI